MYRALTWLARRRGVALDLAADLSALAEENPVDFDEEGRVYIDGCDVTSSIRKPDIDKLGPPPSAPVKKPPVNPRKAAAARRR